VGEQIGLLLFMIIAAKGAAGVSGAGIATLAGGLQTHRPDLVGGVGFILGIDRFMSEARALTNFAGNAVATVLIGSWTNEFNRARPPPCSPDTTRSTRRPCSIPRRRAPREPRSRWRPAPTEHRTREDADTARAVLPGRWGPRPRGNGSTRVC